MKTIKNISLTLLLIISMCFYIYIVDYLNDFGKIIAFILFTSICYSWMFFCDWSKILDKIFDNEK